MKHQAWVCFEKASLDPFGILWLYEEGPNYKDKELVCGFSVSPAMHGDSMQIQGHVELVAEVG